MNLYENPGTRIDKGRDGARRGDAPPTNPDRTVKNRPKADFWTVNTGRKAGFYRQFVKTQNM